MQHHFRKEKPEKLGERKEYSIALIKSLITQEFGNALLGVRYKRSIKVDQKCELIPITS